MLACFWLSHKCGWDAHSYYQALFLLPSVGQKGLLSLLRSWRRKVEEVLKLFYCQQKPIRCLALVLLVQGTLLVSATSTRATFSSSVGYRLIQLNPRRKGDLVINKRYYSFEWLGELEGSIYFFIEKSRAERVTQLAFVLYIGLPEER